MHSALMALTVIVAAGGGAAADFPLTAEGIWIRDPFVLPVPEEEGYYLYGTGSPLGELGFDAYFSKNLIHWTKPFPVFRPPEGFWGTRLFWAPEVHRYGGKYYLFGTFAHEDPIRGTQVCVSNSPRGPFTPIGSGAQTPRDWQCLDGTLFIGRGGVPWMVFCHEWTQVVDGEMCALRLSEDLSKAVGKPTLLFKASHAPWSREIGGKKRHGGVTDGPWLHRLDSGALLMLWSTFGARGKYGVGIARSPSGGIQGPWQQEPKPIFNEHGGHPMLFQTFAGKLMLSLHQPNSGADPHPRFLEVEEREGTLRVKATPDP